MTDFRARGTIMGPAGLTAVFGMGTGVAPPVWSPGRRPAGGQAPPVAVDRWSRHVSRHRGRDRVACIHARRRDPIGSCVADLDWGFAASGSGGPQR